MTNAPPSRTGDADEGDDPLRPGALREHDAAPPSPSLALAGDDLPLLTDALEAAELDRLGIPRRDATPAPAAATANAPPVLAAPAEFPPAELADELARSIEAWLERELPQIVVAELDALAAPLAARIRAETHARMRATLLPALSAPLSAPLARRAGDDTG
ncbi:hypothetical protein [Thauera aromatica]|uniref:Uncharacterized protein n=1 Tax=Thauera aromatica K172 TaxID=44139 RepID=A0A2R4BQ02_THAAR|nr:hypothetical protein [Thauera aromatica]AVR89415.1 hypothetical protein Tharo_2519 [Thauera aromatica K172]